ncbi:uncharacterized protein [Drosophila pseudoobscura]|uniref:tRNA/rRNA methyltransferase SpoU type domain-containing protein n=1 Tax=Drosophila pseudoobscura pseudoobscura TaxID=46245 RepID=A0A6I8UPD7_DROPS|nr:uncharacterized protein LOC4801683 [Drosophila pseudoobscura]
MSLPGTKATTSTTSHAVVQALESYIQNQNLQGDIAELDEMLYDLVDMHKENELALKKVLQCMYNLMQANSKWNVRFGAKVFHKLVSVVICGNSEDTASRRQLVANVLVCVQLHQRKLSGADGKYLLEQLWCLSLSRDRQPYVAQILLHLFDDFLAKLGIEFCQKLFDIIQNLLQSDMREDRRSACFIMRKILEIDEAHAGDGKPKILDRLQCSERKWSAYVDIMESLEEQQSHLVLPTLTTLLPRLALKSSDVSDDWEGWLRILCIRLLQDNNILVLKWTLQYFLTKLSLFWVVSTDLVNEFLAATNRTQLFNWETKDRLSEKQTMEFMGDLSSEVLMESLVQIPWHCVPLLHWLRCIHPDQMSPVAKDLLFKLCARVRILQNPALRKLINERVIFLFHDTIESLSLGDYMMFVESLFNTSDLYMDHVRLTDKVRKCKNFGAHLPYFSKRCYEIVSQHCPDYNLLQAFLWQLQTVPKAQHGWWRLVPVFLDCDFSDFLEEYASYYKVYGFDPLLIKPGAMSLAQMQEHLLEKFNCESRDERSYVLEQSVNLFVRINFTNWCQIEQMNLRPLDLLDRGSQETFALLCWLLARQGERLPDDGVILAALVARLAICNKAKANSYVRYILKYAVSYMKQEEYEEFVKDLLQQRPSCLEAFENFTLPMPVVLGQLLNGETTTGDARIEAAQVYRIANVFDEDALSRSRFLSTAFHLRGESRDVNGLFQELLWVNKELSAKKPRYFENSKEHRTKMRICKALLFLGSPDLVKWSDLLWEALLWPNDQLNVSYMFECLVSNMLPGIDPLLDKLSLFPELTPGKHLSLTSVVHLYCMANWESLKPEELDAIFTTLLPLTMGAHFQTRVLAQLVLHKLAVKCEQTGIHKPIAVALKISIETTLGGKFEELGKEPRLMLSHLMRSQKLNPCFAAEAILYMTDAPFDECIRHSVPAGTSMLEDALRDIRSFFKTKKAGSLAEPTSLEGSINGNVQRKMNPIGDIYPNTDLVTTCAVDTNKQLVVVASLIDKLPNLGGLARTCEVLGVQTLALGNKAQAGKSDFTNLSMTAEKTLNIIELKPSCIAAFLMEKQMEGFRVVGAEQTAHSVSFANFKFPKKCVLLLGHEKHGIPADLIGFLDYAVEIPQFGVVRSLNVHVTGSLFIWEYCKQHFF